MGRALTIFFLCLFLLPAAHAAKVFIPMDEKGQPNHLKAYGVAFEALKEGTAVYWLLNYQGGSFVMEYSVAIQNACKQKGVTCKKMTDAEYAAIMKKMKDPQFNGDIIKLEKPPKIAVYTPLNKEPWDDAVTLARTYAEIPFDKLYANEVLAGDLDKYDWLHLHHEDFTGQYGKFWGQFRTVSWYINDKMAAETTAAKNGFKKVSQMQLAVVKKIRAFVASGGNMFAMCSATDTYDIAHAAEGTDICATPYDGDKMDPLAQSKLDYSKCFAFRDFTVSTNSLEYEYSNIDATNYRFIPGDSDHFMLVNYPAKFDPAAAMLCQNHVSAIKGFMGQTTAFRKAVLKPAVLVLADFPRLNEARYIHGEYGSGTWTFYGGHDPEDYQHMINNPPTDLSKHPNSPGYRLILNNVLFPAAKKKAIQTVVLGDTTGSKPVKPAEAMEQRTLTFAERVKITANPSKDELIIALAPVTGAITDNKIKTVVITTAAGKQVYSRSFNAESVSVKLTDLPSGMFLIQVNGEYAGKVVKN